MQFVEPNLRCRVSSASYIVVRITAIRGQGGPAAARDHVSAEEPKGGSVFCVARTKWMASPG